MLEFLYRWGWRFLWWGQLRFHVIWVWQKYFKTHNAEYDHRHYHDWSMIYCLNHWGIFIPLLFIFSSWCQFYYYTKYSNHEEYHCKRKNSMIVYPLIWSIQLRILILIALIKSLEVNISLPIFSNHVYQENNEYQTRNHQWKVYIEDKIPLKSNCEKFLFHWSWSNILNLRLR